MYFIIKYLIIIKNNIAILWFKQIKIINNQKIIFFIVWKRENCFDMLERPTFTADKKSTMLNKYKMEEMKNKEII